METVTVLFKELIGLTETEKRELIEAHLETLETEEIAKLHRQCETKTFGVPHTGEKYFTIKLIQAHCEMREV